jgi:hypothetical protein
VDLQTVPYTARSIEEGDYGEPVPTTQQFSGTAGEVKDFVVPIWRDEDREANEVFYVNLHDVGPIDFQTPFTYDMSVHHAIVRIMNDDEGPYPASPGSNNVAVYDGLDPGFTLPDGTVTANGIHFSAGAHHYYPNAYNAGSWADAIAVLTAYVSVNGRIDALGIIDHGNIYNGQFLGTAAIPQESFDAIAPLLDDHAHIWLFGCHVGADPEYPQYVANDVAPYATVQAANDFAIWGNGVDHPLWWVTVGHWVVLGPNQWIWYPGSWLTFSGSGFSGL